jgi:acyl-CoA thioester hydrolase
MEFFDNEIRVRYGETDQMGVSYYANYFVWFEESRTEYFRSLGILYTKFEEQGIFLPVVEAHSRYHSPTKYDDLIVCRTWISEMRRTSLRFSYEIFKKDTNNLVVEGWTVHVFANEKFKPVKIPQVVTDSVKVIEKPRKEQSV